MTDDRSPFDPTQSHYARLLAPVYRWMLGDWEKALARSADELRAFGVGAAAPGGRALDLGAGPGLQSIPLADLGYAVTAVDTSEELLASLSAERPQIRIVRADLVDPGDRAGSGYDVIVCMGDTLTHLHTESAVERALTSAAQRLCPGGRLILTFRDYVSATRNDTERFILVRGDADRILTCCLDYGPAKVRVTDIVHEQEDGRWTVRASAYDKLRLSAESVAAVLQALGLAIERRDTSGGRVSLVARKR